VATTGWLGVLVVRLRVVLVLAGQHHSGWLWLPLVIAVLVATSLVIVAPGQTSVVQFFGRTSGPSPARGSGGCCRSPSAAGSRVRVRKLRDRHLKVNDADGNRSRSRPSWSGRSPTPRNRPTASTTTATS